MVIVKQELLYEGNSKRLFRTSAPDFYWLDFKTSASAGATQKQGQIADKGILNNLISQHFFQLLREHGLDNHLIQVLSPREMLVRCLEIIPIQIVVRNVAAGASARRLGFGEGTPLPETVVEFCYNDDTLDAPLINGNHLRTLDLATADEVASMEAQALRASDIMCAHLAERNIDLVDCKLEFGRHHGEVLLGDEISPDTCHFLDRNTGERLSDFGEIYRRLTGSDPILD